MYEVKIIDYDHKGRGMARINDKIIFIPNTMIDEVVKVEITLNKKKYMEGKVIEYIEKSKDRIDNLCPFYEVCGGCDILHLPYSKQLEYKYNKVKNIINRYVKEDIVIKDIVPSDNQFNYRNKVVMHAKDNKIGYYSKGTNSIIEIDNCLLLNNKLNDYIKTITNKKDEVILRTNGDIVLDNDETITMNIGKYKYLVSLESFFQINDNVTYKLYEKIKEYSSATREDNILDLYCGTGTIGIYLSDTCNKVLGIEINKQAIRDANKNKELNNIDNIEFIASDVSKVINKVNFKPTIVVVDPPRAGLDEFTIKEIIKMNPKRLVYTSCDPMTLARDLNILKYYFNIKEITPFDMFPNTYHVENIALLEKK